jgi:hypothetical protein
MELSNCPSGAYLIKKPGYTPSRCQGDTRPPPKGLAEYQCLHNFLGADRRDALE